MANVAQHFANLVPEDQLEAWLFSVIFLSYTKLFFNDKKIKSVRL